jgi:hypothetical protein
MVIFIIFPQDWQVEKDKGDVGDSWSTKHHFGTIKVGDTLTYTHK